MIIDQYYREFIVSGRTDIGKCRNLNEDGFLIATIPSGQEQSTKNDSPEDESILIIVADGVGHPDAGSFASRLIRDYLLEELKINPRSNQSVEVLRSAVEKSNTHLYEKNRAEQSYISSTITAVLIERQVATVAQIGDTRAYLVRDKQLVQVTIDQTLIDVLWRKGLLTEEEKKKHTYSNVVLQALGVTSEIKIGLTQFQLAQNDRVLLCSDGLWRKVSDNEISGILNSNFRVDEACEELIENALDKGGDDNITVVIAEATGEDLPEQAESELPNQMFTILSRLEDPQGLEEYLKRQH
jgi:PPM family protein phosphatase